MAVKKYKAKPVPPTLEAMLVRLIEECQGAIREANRVLTQSKKVIETSRGLIEQSRATRRDRASGR
jgi:hypothetical protein